MDRLIIYDTLIESLLVFLLVFTPLAYGAVRPGAIAVFEAGAALMAFFWILKMLSCSKPELILSPLFTLFLILIGCASLQFFFSKSIYLWATKTELLKLISYAIIFIVTLNTIRTKAQIRRIMVSIITIGFFMGIFYLIRYFGAHAPRGFINSDHFSTYLGMIIPLAIAGIIAPSLDDKGKPQTAIRVLLFFCVITMCAALFFTMSRGGIFSFIASLLFIALLVSTRRSIKKKGWIILTIAVFIILVIAWLGATPVVERILSIKAEISSRYFGGRLPIWQGTIGIIKDNFIFGTGLGTFNYIFSKYQPLEIINKHYTYAHSDILELLSEVGIIGFSLTVVCGLWTVVYLFRRFRERHNPWVVGTSICVFGSLASIFIHSFTDFNLHIPAIAVLLAIILALFVSIVKLHNRSLVVAHGRRIMGYSAAVLSVGLLVVYIVAVVRPAIADSYANTMPASQQGIEAAIRLDPSDAEYHYKLGRLYGKSSMYSLQLAEYQDAVRLNPTNSQYHQSLAWAYGQMKNISEAQQEFKVAIELISNYYYPYQVYAIWLFNHPTKENIEKGVDVYRKAVALDPKLADKALAEYFKIEKRYTQLKKILPDTPENHSNVMAILLDAGLWESSEADFKKDMETSSYKYPYYKTISEYYAMGKDKKKSIQVLEEYLKIDSDCADAHFWIADRSFYSKDYDWEFSEAHHKKAIELQPENPYYKYWYGVHLAYKGQYIKADNLFKEVLNIDPNYAEEIAKFKSKYLK